MHSIWGCTPAVSICFLYAALLTAVERVVPLYHTARVARSVCLTSCRHTTHLGVV